MHELSVALAILSTVEDVAARERAKKIKKIGIRVGLLSLIDVDALVFALKVASRGTIAEGAEIEVELEEPMLECKSCGYRWSIPTDSAMEIARKASPFAHIYPEVVVRNMTCPRCGGRDVEVIRGTQVTVKSVELEL